MKAKFQHFWTLSKNRKGFTLVELIVVIAILAILAGVAIPVYNGYIKKAQNAADQQVLDSINTAYAAACLSESVNHEDVVAFVTINADGLICEKDANGQYRYAIAINDAKGANADEIMSSFAMFYAGNETAAFKGEQFLGKTFSLPIVEGGASAEGYITLNYGNGTITISAADAQKLANSTFNNKLGIAGMLNKVNEVADFASAVNSATFTSIIGSSDFQKTFLENMGVKTDGMYDYEIGGAFNNEMNAILGNMGIDLDTATNDEIVAAQNKVMSNMAVLYAAQSTGGMNDDQIKNLLYTDTPKQTILAGATNGDQLAQAALYYGMYVGYANYSGDDALIGATDNPIALLNSLNETNTAGFQEYLDTDQGKADLEAYMASMNIIRDSANGNADAVGNLMSNGFNDPDLVELLQSAMGK